MCVSVCAQLSLSNKKKSKYQVKSGNVETVPMPFSPPHLRLAQQCSTVVFKPVLELNEGDIQSVQGRGVIQDRLAHIDLHITSSQTGREPQK